MSIGSLDQYKAQVRLVGNFDDALLQSYADSAEQHAAAWLSRTLYPDADTLAAAVAAVPAALDVANTAYQAALVAAGAITDYALREMAVEQARNVFNDAFTTAKATYLGMVMNEAVQVACYLLAANWYANREAVVDSKAAVELPFGVQNLLQPYRKQMGV